MRTECLLNGERVELSRSEIEAAIRHWVKTQHFIREEIHVYTYALGFPVLVEIAVKETSHTCD